MFWNSSSGMAREGSRLYLVLLNWQKHDEAPLYLALLHAYTAHCEGFILLWGVFVFLFTYLACNFAKQCIKYT